MNVREQIKQDNEEVLKFLVKNQKKLAGHQLSIWRRTEYKDVKSLLKVLIVKTKNPTLALTIGMQDKKNRLVTYKFRKRNEMEKLLNSGNLGYVDIKTTDRDIRSNAIKKFGTSA